jgi:hypothetical protein
MGKEG